jgi:hypothetical protein
MSLMGPPGSSDALATSASASQRMTKGRVETTRMIRADWISATWRTSAPMSSA